jgi:hypothetical protein
MVRPLVAKDERVTRQSSSSTFTVTVEQHGTASIALGDVPAAYVSVGSLSSERPAHLRAEGTVRVSVETLHRFGGISPRAFLGGEFIASDAPNISLEVEFSDDDIYTGVFSTEATCPSRLMAESFRVGLPQEFATAVIDGFRAYDDALPAGVLRIDRAGFDEMNSSGAAFQHAMQVLCAVTRAAATGGEMRAAAEAGLLKHW